MPFKTTALLVFSLVSLTLSHLCQAAEILVDVTSDGTGAANECELRDAIEAANSNSEVDGCNAGSGADLITFNLPAAVITLTSALPQITESLEIAGPGIDELMIDGNESFRIFDVFASGHFTLRNIHLFHGLANVGGCILIQSVDTILIEDVHVDSCATDTSGSGGAKVTSSAPDGTATFRRVVFSANSAFQAHGGLSLVSSEGLIEDSLFENNLSINSSGTGGALGVGVASNVTIRRTTFWGNQAKKRGTAIVLFATSAVVNIEHCTISQNNLTGTLSVDPGGAIHNIGSLTLFNTVVADNTEQNGFHDTVDVLNDESATLTTLGFNLIGNNEGASSVFPTGVQPNGDQVGEPTSILDPKLNVLGPNGGPTHTAMPMSDSPLLDKGSCPGEVMDQRGFMNINTGLRPVDAPGIPAADDNCDIGAVEYLAEPSDILHKDGFEG